MTNKVNYARIQAKVKKILERFGFDSASATIKISGQTNNFYEKAVIVEKTYYVPAVKGTLSSGERDMLIKAGHYEIEEYYKFLITTTEFTDVTIGSILSAGGKNYKVISRTKVEPYSTVLLFKLYVELAK